MTASFHVLTTGNADDRVASTVTLLTEGDTLAVVDPGMVADRRRILGPSPSMTLVAHRAGATCLLVELDDDGLGAAQGGGAPPGAGVSAWAGGLPLVPVDGESGAVETGAGMCSDRGDQGDLEVLLHAHDQIGGGVTGVEEVSMTSTGKILKRGLSWASLGRFAKCGATPDRAMVVGGPRTLAPSGPCTCAGET